MALGRFFLLLGTVVIVALQENCKEDDESCQIVGDVNRDGVLENDERLAMRLKMRDLFDIDESGSVDTDEIRGALGAEKDISCVYSSLDANQDSQISSEEIDNRWEKLGSELTIDEVTDWLTYAVQLPQYAPIFQKHAVSGYSFPLLIEDDGHLLKEIGIQSDLHRKQLAMIMKKRFAGFGTIPLPVDSLECKMLKFKKPSTVVYQITWAHQHEDPVRFQLQSREQGHNTWSTKFIGSEVVFDDVVETLDPVAYRLTVWNSFSRSKRVYVSCENDLDDHSHSKGNSLWSYISWLDDIGLALLCIFMPYRLYVNGHADFIQRILRRLPPNRPTRVILERIERRPAIRISWTEPVDNGTKITSYVVRCTNVRNGEMKSVMISELPLATSAEIDELVHGDTYKVVVEAFNDSGLSAESSQSVYMLPYLSPPRKPRNPVVTAGKTNVGRNKCYICKDPVRKSEISRLAIFDRKILHYCASCDLQFCHGHRGSVDHSKTLSCPAIDGNCICVDCLQAQTPPPLDSPKKLKFK